MRSSTISIIARRPESREVPEELVIQNSAFLPEMIGVDPPRSIYSHIIGIDLVRTGENEFVVLEDNTRTPSGVSDIIENCETMMHLFPDLFSRNRVRPIENYPDALMKTLEGVAPSNLDAEPTIALLTPASTTAPISNIRSLPIRWASNLWKVVILS